MNTNIELLKIYDTIKSVGTVTRDIISKTFDIKKLGGLSPINMYTQESNDMYTDEVLSAFEKELDIQAYTTESELMELQPIASSIVSALAITVEDGVVLPEDVSEVYFSCVYKDTVHESKEEIVEYLTTEASQDYGSIWYGIISKDRSTDIPLTTKEARFISNIKNEKILNYI